MDLIRLAAELNDTRRGIGPRRRELRQHLATIDPLLRHDRNAEKFRQADLKFRLRTLDTRADPSSLQAALEQSTKQLANLDLQILRALAARLVR